MKQPCKVSAYWPATALVASSETMTKSEQSSFTSCDRRTSANWDLQLSMVLVSCWKQKDKPSKYITVELQKTYFLGTYKNIKSCKEQISSTCTSIW